MSFLDKKDLVIMQAFIEHGPKISTHQIEDLLSDILNISDRAIRYRIIKLKEKGIMRPFVINTHERKIGIGDNLVLMNVNNKKAERLVKLIEFIPYIYMYSSTYGNFNGFLFRSIYSLKDPQMTHNLLKTMKKEGYIYDFHIFDVVDYQVKSQDLSYFIPKKGWIWKWEEWYDHLEETLSKTDLGLNFNLEIDSEIVNFDYKDTILLKNLISTPSISMRELNSVLKLSESQIRKRIRRLTENGIIRGYFINYDLTHNEDYVYLYCFLETSKSVESIISWFSQIPYLIMILFESPHKVCFQLKLNAKDLKKFLQGIDLIRPYVNSYLFQLAHNQIKENPQYIFDLYNPITNSWETPIKDYVKLIENFG
ncbi:MAG: winged helix-turn-helix transcriptional regulator [Promethearchaeota archaeon]|jgi:DNA-binding Lrp family transcriptional regulator